MREPFIEVSRHKKPGFNMGVLLNSKTIVKGEVGIEIEVEGKNFLYPHMGNVPSPWSYKEDHSLRGEENGEYVLQHPIMFAEVEKSLKTLFDAFEKNKAKFDDSNRTSVHVHLNCQKFHLNRLATLMALWFTFEEILTQWCGEYRVGNLFCLRGVRDASGIVYHLRKFLKSDGKYELSDNLHYAGFNAHALRKFGSVEIRTMRGVSDPKIIQDWVEILQRLYEYSAEFNDPRDVCGIFSGYGPMQMFNTVLGNKAVTVRSCVNWSDEQIKNSLHSGIRMAQDLCYCRDWSLYMPKEVAPDPFKRDQKKIVKKLLAYDDLDWASVATSNNLNPLGEIYIGGGPATLQWTANGIGN